MAVALSIVGTATSRAAGAGAYNDRGCVPSAAHPDPVVLLHGLGASPDGDFGYIGPQLAAAGYCAFAFNYGSTPPLSYPGGFAAMDDSATAIRAFISEVRGFTGASKVDIVGHSEGALHSLYVPKRFGLGDEVGRVVALAPPTHGTDGSGFLTLARSLGLPPLVKPLTDLFGCTACDEIAISQDFIHRLNDGPIAVAGISYTILASRADVIVTPTETSFVRETGVSNVVIQDICPTDPVGHIGLAFDSGVLQMITNALDPANASPVTCSFGIPI